jgi:hypothetical protein
MIIGMKIGFLTHFYARKYEMKLGSDKETYPSRVLFIDPIKRINDYYALGPNILKTVKVC